MESQFTNLWREEEQMSNYKFNDWFLKKQLEAIDDIMKNNNMTWDEDAKSYVREKGTGYYEQ